MKTAKQRKTTRLAIAAWCVALSFAGTFPLHAALVPFASPNPETPGVTLDANTLGLVGTVVATLDDAFVDNAMPTPFAQGTLRTLVVDRGAGLLDFYYQLVNRSQVPDFETEFFRLKTTGGFDPSLVLMVGQTNDISALVAGASSGYIVGGYATGGALKPAATADRDVATIGSVGFDFPAQPPLPFIDDLRNVRASESSAFLVVRTNATEFRPIPMVINGAATSFARTYSGVASVPEPASVALLGLGIGLCVWRRPRLRRADGHSKRGTLLTPR